MTRLQLFWRDFKFFDTTWPFWHDINFFGMTSTFLARLQLFWRNFNFFGTTSPFWHNFTFLAWLQLFWHDFTFSARLQLFWHDFNFFWHDFNFFGTTSTFLTRLHLLAQLSFFGTPSSKRQGSKQGCLFWRDCSEAAGSLPTCMVRLNQNGGTWWDGQRGGCLGYDGKG